MTERKKLILITAAIIVLVTVVIGIGLHRQSDNSRPKISVPRVAHVQISEDGFEPSSLKINAGTEVIWTNDDTEIHSIEAAMGTNYQSLNSRTNLDKHGTYRYTFDNKGVYKYHDKLNPTINGSVTVN